MKNILKLFILLALISVPCFASPFAPSIGFMGGSTATTLHLDFTNGTLPSGTALTRNSTASNYDSSGVLTIAAIDAARFEHAPTTHTALGILIEPAATNSVSPVSPTGCGTNWGCGNVGPAENATTSPLGTTTASSLTESNTYPFTHIEYETVTFTAASGTYYTMSCFFKGDTATVAQLFHDPATFGYNAYANFDLSAGTVGTKGSASTSTIQDVNNSWYRASNTAPATSDGAAASADIAFTNNNASSGFAPSYSSNGYVMYAFGCNLTEGATLSSYIPGASRAADDLTITIPSGITHITYTFDDDSTQDTSGLSAGTYHVPTTLNRPIIKTIDGHAT